MKRLFVGLSVPEWISKEFRESIRPFIQSLDRREIAYRAPRAQNDHLTLAFLGPQDQAREAQAVAALQSLRSERFELRWRGLDAFPNQRSARVVFAGFEAEPRLIELHQQLGQALRTAGFELEDREFVPHLTIARLSRPARLDCALDLEWDSGRLPSLPVNRVILYESRPGPGGSTYVEVASTELR